MSVEMDNEPQARQQASPTSGRRRHILLADDDAEMRALLVLALTHEGYDVTECCDGIELSIRLQKSIDRETQPVDVVISDIRMPGLSGLMALAVHRCHPRCPPVILMSAFGDATAPPEARRLGAAAYLDKPFRLDDLMQRVHELAPTSVSV